VPILKLLSLIVCDYFKIIEFDCVSILKLFFQPTPMEIDSNEKKKDVESVRF